MYFTGTWCTLPEFIAHAQWTCTTATIGNKDPNRAERKEWQPRKRPETPFESEVLKLLESAKENEEFDMVEDEEQLKQVIIQNIKKKPKKATEAEIS